MVIASTNGARAGADDGAAGLAAAMRQGVAEQAAGDRADHGARVARTAAGDVAAHLNPMAFGLGDGGKGGGHGEGRAHQGGGRD